MSPRSEPSDAQRQDAQRQNWSALADGELTDAELADALALWRVDRQARRDWHAYHLIGDVLRSDELAAAPARDEAFLQALRGRLAQEPVPLAPAPLATPATGTAPRPGASRAAQRRHWWVAPAAVAAGFVAVATVMVVTQVGGPGEAPGPRLASQGAPVVADTGASAVLVRNPQLDRYLSAHRSLALGNAPAGGAEQRVHIVYEGR